MLTRITAGPVAGRGVGEEPQGIDVVRPGVEVGSTFTIQGFDLNYAGLIIGPSVRYVDGKVVFDAGSSKNSKATNKRDGTKDFSRQNLSNELNVLLKRGVHGLYLFAVDPDLQEALKRAASGCKPL
ncbi:DNA/RNA helicase domain-containing protein [Paratractidigestivibacter faecalis]|uniref:DNA/RNA helicase domain-containing protein n=1 Tax=Paratractidigestivibacter faecalis TaxID=2292441 RepID=UPI0038CD7960